MYFLQDQLHGQILIMLNSGLILHSLNTIKFMNKNWFIQRYSDIHSDLDKLEKEIEENLKNKKDLLENDQKLEDLKRKTIETIDLLNKTREDERRIFNY